MPPSPRPALAIREQFLRKLSSATPFYRLFDAMPDVSFFAKDHRFRFVCASRRFIERFGLREESEIVGRNDFELFPARIAESFRRDDEEVLSTGEAKLNIVELFFTEQGVPDWFITNKLPLCDRRGRVVGLMGTVQNYEHRRQVLQPYLQLDRAVAYVRENFRRGVSVKELSHAVHISPRHLHRKFVETFGSSPQAFIIKLRIQAACEALQRQGSQIGEVALSLGFCDQSSFTQLFQKHVGLTPLKYQKRFQLQRGGAASDTDGLQRRAREKSPSCRDAPVGRLCEAATYPPRAAPIQSKAPDPSKLANMIGAPRSIASPPGTGGLQR